MSRDQVFENIVRRQDGSYVITRNGMPYHVPNEGEYAELWVQVDAFAKAHLDEVSDAPEDPEPTLDEARASAKAALRQKRLSIEYGGFAFNGQTWDSSEKDELRLNSMLKMFELTGMAEFPGWKIADGEYITATPAIIAGAAVALMQHYAAVFAVEESKVAEIAACSSVEEIEGWMADALNAGWPGEV